MWKQLRENGISAILSVLLHVLILSFLVFGFSMQPKHQSPKTSQENIIQAKMVDDGKVQEEIDRLKKDERRQREEEIKRQKQLEELNKKKLEAEKELQRQQALTEKRKIEEEKARVEQAKLEAQKKQQQRELKELQRKQAEAKKELEKVAAAKAAEEKRKAEQEARRKAEQEAKRKADEERRKQEKLRAEQQRRQDELKRQLEAEESAERQRELLSKKEQYIEDIKAVIRNNWRKPGNAGNNDTCQVYVRQIPGGQIVSYQVTKCTGDALFQRSVELALSKSSPLPSPPDPDVFDRDIIFNFKVEK